MNARNYQKILDYHLLSVFGEIKGLLFMFQHENDPMQNTNYSFEWFLSNCLHFNNWPALILD